MRVLLLTSSSAYAMVPPQLGDHQIVAGPDWPDAQNLEGEWISLRTPEGEYDLELVLSKIPSSQRPDVVFVFADGSWRNQPRNVACFSGKRILLYSAYRDTAAAMPQLFRYLGDERFDRVLRAVSPSHQERFFAATAAEFRTDRHDVAWLPSRQPAWHARAI